MAFTDFADGNVLTEAQLDENFDRTGLMVDESTQDTTEYSQGDDTTTLKQTYTLTPDYTPAVPVFIKLEADMKVSAAGVSRSKFDLTDGTITIRLLSGEGDGTSLNSTSTTYETVTKTFIPVYNSASANVAPTGDTLALKMYLESNTGGITAYIKNITVTFYYFAGGKLTTSSAKIVGS